MNRHSTLNDAAHVNEWYLLSDGRHQVSTAVTESRNRSLLLLLIQHFKLILGEGLTGLWHDLNHIHNQDLSDRMNPDQKFDEKDLQKQGILLLLCLFAELHNFIIIYHYK